MASIVGQSRGRRFYTVSGHRRSWEGSAAMGAAAFASILVTLLLLPGSAWSPFSSAVAAGRAFLMALLGSLVATVAEGLSPAGTDNLTVPLLTGSLLYLLVAA